MRKSKRVLNNVPEEQKKERGGNRWESIFKVTPSSLVSYYCLSRFALLYRGHAPLWLSDLVELVFYPFSPYKSVYDICSLISEEKPAIKRICSQYYIPSKAQTLFLISKISDEVKVTDYRANPELDSIFLPTDNNDKVMLVPFENIPLPSLDDRSLEQFISLLVEQNSMFTNVSLLTQLEYIAIASHACGFILDKDRHRQCFNSVTGMIHKEGIKKISGLFSGLPFNKHNILGLLGEDSLALLPIWLFPKKHVRTGELVIYPLYRPYGFFKTIRNPEYQATENGQVWVFGDRNEWKRIKRSVISSPVNGVFKEYKLNDNYIAAKAFADSQQLKVAYPFDVGLRDSIASYLKLLYGYHQENQLMSHKKSKEHIMYLNDYFEQGDCHRCKIPLFESQGRSNEVRIYPKNHKVLSSFISKDEWIRRVVFFFQFVLGDSLKISLQSFADQARILCGYHQDQIRHFSCLVLIGQEHLYGKTWMTANSYLERYDKGDSAEPAWWKTGVHSISPPYVPRSKVNHQ